MDSTTGTSTHNFSFAGTVEELLEVVRDWRALLPGDLGDDLRFLSYSNLTGQPGREMGSRNPDTYTTRRLGEHERVHLGREKTAEDGGAIRRVTWQVSLIRWEELHIPWRYAGEPASMHWRYHPGYFGQVTLGFRRERGAFVGNLQFPNVVKEECTELLTMLSLWKPDQTPQAGAEPAPGMAQYNHLLETLDRYAKAATIPSSGWQEIQEAIDNLPRPMTITHAELRRRLGKSESTIRNKLRVT
jgi:hypothetical protein